MPAKKKAPRRARRRPAPSAVRRAKTTVKEARVSLARTWKDLESGLADLQARAKRQRRALGRTVEATVHGALAALNIPSRQEIQELTRRVDELSRKIDRFRG